MPVHVRPALPADTLKLTNHFGTWPQMAAAYAKEASADLLRARSLYVSQSLLNSSAWQRARSVEWVVGKRVERKLQRQAPAHHIEEHAPLAGLDPDTLAGALHMEDTLRWLGAAHKSALGARVHKTGLGWGATIVDTRAPAATLHAHRFETLTPQAWEQHAHLAAHHPNHHLSVLGVGAGLAGVYPHLLNEAGVFVTVHPHTSNLQKLSPHPPRAGVLLDALCKAPSARALVERLRARPWAGGATLVISDPAGGAWVLDKGQRHCTASELTDGLHIITAHEITSTSAKVSWEPALSSWEHATRARSRALHRHLRDTEPQGVAQWAHALCDRSPEHFLASHTPLPAFAGLAVMDRADSRPTLWVRDAQMTHGEHMRPVRVARGHACFGEEAPIPLPAATTASRATEALVLAAQSIQRGDTRRALTHAELALAMHPKSVPLQTMVALCALRAHKWTRAEGALRVALSLAPSTAWSSYIQLYLAWALHAQGQPLAAKHIYTDLRQSAHLAPRHASMVAKRAFPSRQDLTHTDIDFLTFLPIH